nr:MAG TPA: hypothetical protein [Bacteriophage sp.]
MDSSLQKLTSGTQYLMEMHIYLYLTTHQCTRLLAISYSQTILVLVEITATIDRLL